jgi:ubiquinone/menaquinone biosynthesis C-methylase UbiE
MWGVRDAGSAYGLAVLRSPRGRCPVTGVAGDEPVSPGVYTEDYYLGCASGFDRWEASKGLDVPPLVLDVLERAGVAEGCRVLDVGCGRGEVVLNAARVGAWALGIDYSDAALGLARRMRGEHPDFAERASFLKCDAKLLPLAPASIDRVFMLDVVEHLHPWELEAALREVHRVLRPDGALFVHTMPNLRFYRFVYPPLRLMARVVQGKRLPADPRSEYEHAMHVNEQTPRGLRRVLEATGFRTEIWFSDFVRSPLDRGRLDRVVRAVGKRGPLRPVATFNIFAAARPVAAIRPDVGG